MAFTKWQYERRKPMAMMYPKFMKPEKALYELKLAKLKKNLQPAIRDAEQNVYAEYSLDAMLQDMDNSQLKLMSDAKPS